MPPTLSSRFGDRPHARVHPLPSKYACTIHHPQVEPPSEEACLDGDGQRRMSLQVPHCLGRKPQEVTDSHGVAALAWDFVVHPEALERAAVNPAVMAILAEVVRLPPTK
jgi:hypothetical protein